MKKRVLILIGAVLLILALLVIVACAGNDSSAPTGQTFRAGEPQSESSPTTSAATGSGSISRSSTSATSSTSTTTTSQPEQAPSGSDGTSISIDEVTSGSSKDKVTYFVADVVLGSGADLQSAFAQGFRSGAVDYTSTIAAENGAVFAVNGDYCTARNTGIIIRNGVLYLNQPTRDGLAIYKDGTMKVYDETEISAEQLLADGVWNTFSFGPVLLEDGAIPEGLDTTEVEDIGQEHTILGTQPRTAVGFTDTNHFIFVVVDGRETGYSRGVTLSELAQILKDLGCGVAYNLDGGGSSAMYYNGELVNNPLGEGKERGISDILMVVGSADSAA
jgi:exopolysaccharide biosynthesis protein